MATNLTINSAPHANIQITLNEGTVYVLIGKNASGKSRLLTGIKQSEGSAILLKGNYENVAAVDTVNKETIQTRQRDERFPFSVASLVAGDPELLKIFQYYYKILFDAEIKVVNNQFQINGIVISEEADGLKAIFNLLYYLISDHKIILLDEPERFFHPSMKSVFISLVSEIAKNYSKIVVLTSHSEETIRFDIDNVEIWLIRTPIVKVNDWIINLADPAYPSQRDKTQFTDWISYHTEVFFSQNNGLVEGVSDQVVLNAIKNKLALKYNFEHISISHVGSSHHEAGGKSRLHKYQTFLSKLNRTFVIADLDVIPGDITKWFTPAVGTSVADQIIQARVHKLHVLSLGEIEDYYFLGAGNSFCTTAANAKNHKISAAYEQARIISRKTINEVEAKFSEIVDMLKIYATPAGADTILKDLAKSYLIDKYGKGFGVQSHLDDTVTAGNIDIKFKFAGHGKSMQFPQQSLDKIKELGNEIDQNLQ